MKKYLSLILLLCACGREPAQPTERIFSGQWLQLDKYFPDSCFIFDESDHTVWVFDEGEEEQTHKEDWVWQFTEPNLYTFNNEIDLYVLPSENDCWVLDVYGAIVNACPCVLIVPPQSREE